MKIRHPTYLNPYLVWQEGDPPIDPDRVCHSEVGQTESLFWYLGGEIVLCKP